MNKILRNFIMIGFGLTIVWMNITPVNAQTLWNIAKDNNGKIRYS